MTSPDRTRPMPELATLQALPEYNNLLWQELPDTVITYAKMQALRRAKGKSAVELAIYDNVLNGLQIFEKYRGQRIALIKIKDGRRLVGRIGENLRSQKLNGQYTFSFSIATVALKTHIRGLLSIEADEFFEVVPLTPEEEELPMS